MESWAAPDLPVLPEPAAGRPPLSLYDSARLAVAPTGDPSSPARTMYVCGITPYDATHLGHAATMITFDLANRFWRDEGHRVGYVQNVTDIDDPLLERAKRDGSDWVVLAMRETALFREDMEALRIVPPEYYIGAVESIPRIVERVLELVDRSVAYRLEDGTGDVYFDLTAAPSFGSESHLDRATMRELSAQRGGDPDRAGKRDPLDPLLWRGAREGEPAWDGAGLGAGRPGWHIECAVIALDRLGDTIDIQGGGNDLLYPHHECSAAHAEVMTGAPFARHFVHAGMIGLDGEKMSKSKGNLVFVSRLRGDGVDPMAIRLALMSQHYRSDRQWTDDMLKAGQKRLSTWREASSVGLAAASEGSADEVVGELRAALADDLDTPRAYAAIDTWADRVLAGERPGGAAEVVDAVDALLGITLRPVG